jgi:tetratricopeptide (TPR) repeat protein
MLRRVFVRLLRGQPTVEALLAAARAHQQAGRFEAAVDAARLAAARFPNSADAAGFLGTMLIEAAREAYRRAAARRSDAAGASLRLYREAAAALQRAQVLAPNAPRTYRNYGIALREMGELADAARMFESAYRLRPEDPEFAADAAFGLQCLGRTEDAIALYERALAAHPDDANLHMGMALSLLGRGDYGRGWDEYEWRLRLPQAGVARGFPFPVWGGEALTGRSLLVYSEQGIGDEIMFASCFPDLLETAENCVLESSLRLASLFARSFPRATIIARERGRMPDWSRLPEINLQVAAGSVPRFLRKGLAGFPARRGYLTADSHRVARWRARLEAAGPGPKVGLAWTGGLPGTLRASRSLALSELAPLLGACEAQFVALEFLDCAHEVAAYNRGGAVRPLHWWPEAVRDIEETAALLCALDLVISVTTATAHLAGALGRPTWILVPGVPTWRYGWEGERMPWYPSARVLRRGADQSREAFVAGAARELAALTAAHE